MDEAGSNSSDSVELVNVMEQDGSPLTNGNLSPTEGYSDEDFGDQPHIVISQQPQARGFRFRYECEGPSHGGLQGQASQKYRKTFPSVRIKNYNGAARIVVSLATDEPIPKAHAHKLVGRHCQDGICTVENKPGMSEIEFPNLCVQHITKRKASEVLQHRICEAMALSKKVVLNDLNADVELTDEEQKIARKEAGQQAKHMHLNVVRLCFQAYLRDSSTNKFTRLLPSVVSNTIYDSKAPGANALKICRMDKNGGCCTGNDEVFLLCEKVQKDDIQVKFIEQDDEGKAVWEGYGNFGPFDVHRQFAIVFKTPAYWNTNIEKAVNVLIVLQRKSDGEMSDGRSFTYYPQSFDQEDIERKRKKPLPNFQHDARFDMNTPGGLNGGGGGGAPNGDSPGGGTLKGGPIPKFDDMRLHKFGQIPPIITGGGGPRPTLQATRPRQSRSLNKPRHPEQVFPSQHSQFRFEMATPGHGTSNQGNNISAYTIGGMGTQLPSGGIGTQLPSGSPMSYTSQASPGNMTELSPQMRDTKSPLMNCINGQVQGHNMNTPIAIDSVYSSTTGSPHMNTASPIQIDSPQMTGSQQISGAQQVNGYPATQNFPVTQIKHEIDELTGILATGAGVCSQPVQVSQSSDLTSVDSLEMDLFQPFSPVPITEQMLQQFGQQPPSYLMHGQQKSTLGQLETFSHYYGAHSCQYQARNATGGMFDTQAIQDAVTAPSLDFFDGRGYDEVDATRVDGLPLPVPSADVDLVPRIGKIDVVPRIGKRIQHGDLASLQRPQKGLMIAKETIIATEMQSSQDAVVTKETGVQAGSTHTAVVDCQVQTDSNPMLKSALKTSEALQYYAASGDIRYLLMVQRYLMSVHDENGDLPLHTALINTKYEVFQNLLDVMVTLPDSSTRINAYNYNRQTPLHLAVLTNQPRAVDLLIRARADPMLVDRNGYTPAHLAVLYARDDCMACLLKYVRPGVNPDTPFPELNTHCYEGFTPVHLAAQLESLAIMKLLVRARADVNIADGKSGRTALHHAVEVDELSIAAYLILQAGSQVNVKRFDGNTPLHIACGRGNIGMVALLMAGGADPDTENDDVHETSICSSDDESMSESDEDESVEKPDSAKGDKQQEQSSDVELPTRQLESTTTTDREPETQDTGRIREPASRSGSVRCRGLTPADFANCNNQIMRILNGEPYTSLAAGDTQADDTDCEQTTARLKSLQLNSKQESGFGSLGIQSYGGDMYKVDYPTRVGLSRLLDPSQPGADWLTLASRLGLRKVIEGQTGEQSPTRLLLTYFEECGGTVSKLSNALCDINREDAINLLNNSKQTSAPVTTSVDKDTISDGQHDSGFTTESYLASHRKPLKT